MLKNNPAVMSNSRFKTQMYPADQFVESAGTILFRLSTREVCILHLFSRDEYILHKGRRNLGESRAATATRETTEETGLRCRLLPVDLASRVCPATEETGHVPDEARLFRGACEPISVQIRHLGRGEVKFIWWYVAAVDEDELIGQHEKDNFEVEFHSYDSVVGKLTFQDDRELVRKAIGLVESSGRPSSRISFTSTEAGWKSPG